MKNPNNVRFGQMMKLERMMWIAFQTSFKAIKAVENADAAKPAYYTAVRQCTIVNACRSILRFKEV